MDGYLVQSKDKKIEINNIIKISSTIELDSVKWMCLKTKDAIVIFYFKY